MPCGAQGVPDRERAMGEATDISTVLRGEARWAIVTGDCTDLLRTLPDLCIDVCCTDPPYSARVHTNATQHARAGLREGNGKLSRAALSRRMDLGFAHLMSSTRRAVAREAGRLVRRWTMAFSDEDSMHLWRRSFEAVGLEAVRSMFWLRRGGAPQFTGDRPAVAVEAITLVHPRGRKRWNGGGKAGIYDYPIVANRCGHRTDRIFSTQKPIELMVALLRDFTDPDDLVLDPFCGSGSTGAAALLLGRRFIGVEIDPTTAGLARRRMAAVAADSTLLAADAGQLPLLGAG